MKINFIIPGEPCGKGSAENDAFIKAFEKVRTMPLQRLKPKVLCVFPGGIPLIDERGLFDSDDDAHDDGEGERA